MSDKNFITVKQIYTSKGWLDNATVNINDGKIASIKPNDSRACIDGILIPGYIDLQVNGGGGFLFNDDPSFETIAKIANAHQQFGTTVWLPTLVTDSFKKMECAANAVSQSIAKDEDGVIGIHFEGPYLSSNKKGIHEKNFLRTLSNKEFDLLCRKDIGKVLLTLAPEICDNKTIKKLTDAGIIVSIGHSDATFEQTNAALNAGATGFTHLFNAMSAFTSREPGVVGAALLDKKSYAGIILDGIHVHSQSAKLAAQLKKNLILVTDAMPPVGSLATEFNFFSQQIKRLDNRLIDENNRLAGSTLDMHSAVKNAQTMLSIQHQMAIDMASIKPAEFLKLDHSMGSLEVGKTANMVLLDQQHTIKTVWRKGIEIFNA